MKLLQKLNNIYDEFDSYTIVDVKLYNSSFNMRSDKNTFDEFLA